MLRLTAMATRLGQSHARQRRWLNAISPAAERPRGGSMETAECDAATGVETDQYGAPFSSALPA